MDNHDYLVDNEDSKNAVDEEHQVRCTQMCSYQQDELTENCSYHQADTCRECDTTTQERYVKILDFRHFEKHFGFSRKGQISRKKSISDGVNVSVVLDMVSGNTPK